VNNCFRHGHAAAAAPNSCLELKLRYDLAVSGMDSDTVSKIVAGLATTSPLACAAIASCYEQQL